MVMIQHHPDKNNIEKKRRLMLKQDCSIQNSPVLYHKINSQAIVDKTDALYYPAIDPTVMHSLGIFL